MSKLKNFQNFLKQEKFQVVLRRFRFEFQTKDVRRDCSP